MDRQVVWSPEALEDAEAIADYIGRDSAAYASAVVTKIVERRGALSVDGEGRAGTG